MSDKEKAAEEAYKVHRTTHKWDWDVTGLFFKGFFVIYLYDF